MNTPWDLVFLKYWTLITVRFGNQPEAVRDLYFEFLEEAQLTAEQLEQGFREGLKRSRFLPAPIELIDWARGSERELARNAWYDVMKSYHDNQRIDDPSIRKILTLLGGTQFIKQASGLERQHIKDDFIELYSSELNQRLNLRSLPSRIPKVI